MENNVYICDNKTNKHTAIMTNAQTAIQELGKVNFAAIIEAATKQFSNACFDEGLTVEKTRQLMCSAEGLEIIAKLAAKAI
jgi:hypothetical protein